MRIAVACDGLMIAPNFVQCTSYMCYTAELGVVVDSRNMPALDQPLEKLPAFFEAIEADALITGRIDGELAGTLEACGLEVIPDAAGDPLTAARSYLAGSKGERPGP